MVTPMQAEMYFRGFIKGWRKGEFIGAGVISGLIMIACFWNGSWGWGFIFLIACAVIYYIVSLFPSDADIDRSFIELKDEKAKGSLDRLGIEKQDIIREPFIVMGADVERFEDSVLGEDKVMRYNPMVAAVIHFGKNQIFVNEISLNLIEPNGYVGKTNEFFYKDISSVSIQDEKAGKMFSIKVQGEIELAIAVDMDRASLEAAEEAVSTIRKMLREKKQS
ncbi:hypothetical protein [Helicobacter sp. T3_23-1056]